MQIKELKPGRRSKLSPGRIRKLTDELGKWVLLAMDLCLVPWSLDSTGP